MNAMKKEKMVKIVFAGETNVGKTSIIEKSLTDRFSAQTPTVGAAFAAKKATHNGKSITLGIWDTAGQERYQSMSSIYFRQAIICVLVFDLTNYGSFEKIAMWRNLCDDSNSEYHNKASNIPIYILVGNKLDMQDRTVDKSEILLFCQDNDIAHYIETSAYTGEGIKSLYEIIAEEACDIKLPIVSKGLTVGTTNPDTNHYCQCYQ